MSAVTTKIRILADNSNFYQQFYSYCHQLEEKNIFDTLVESNSYAEWNIIVIRMMQRDGLQIPKYVLEYINESEKKLEAGEKIDPYNFGLVTPSSLINGYGLSEEEATYLIRFLLDMHDFASNLEDTNQLNEIIGNNDDLASGIEIVKAMQKMEYNIPPCIQEEIKDFETTKFLLPYVVLSLIGENKSLPYCEIYNIYCRNIRNNPQYYQWIMTPTYFEAICGLVTDEVSRDPKEEKSND